MKHLIVDENNREREHGSDSVKNAVSDINFHVKFVNEHTAKNKNWDDVNYEAITSP